MLSEGVVILSFCSVTNGGRNVLGFGSNDSSQPTDSGCCVG
jgi:hypothetical protein